MAILILISVIFSAITAEDASIQTSQVEVFLPPDRPSYDFITSDATDTAICSEYFCFSVAKTIFHRSDELVFDNRQ